MSESQPRKQDTVARRWMLFSVGALAFLAFANTLGHALVYDDKLILTSPLVQDPWNFRALFSSDYYDSPKGNLEIYRPLANISFVVNYELNRWLTGDGANSFGFHLATVLCHVIASLFVFLWIDRLWPDPAGKLRSVAWTAAILFAVHPIHCEAVANVSGRSEPLAAAFGLAFLIAHRSRRIFGAALLYFCALWSKESAIAFFPVAVLVDWLVPSASKRLVRSYAVLALTLAAWLVLRSAGLHDPPSPVAFIDNPLVRVTTLERVCSAAKVQMIYLRLAIVPIGQSTDYSFDHIALARGPLDPVVLGFAGFLIVAMWIAAKYRRAAPAVPLAIGAYGLSFAATSNFFFPIGTLMAERLAYTPSIFVCLLASVAAWQLAPKVGRGTITVAVGVITAAGLALTLSENRIWRDEPTLFRDQVRTAPDSAKAHLNLAQTLASAGDYRSALAEYEESARIAPDYGWTWYFIGDAHHRLNEREPALDAWRRAVDVDPNQVDAQIGTVVVLLELGRRNEALLHVTEILARDPEHPALKGLVQRVERASGPDDRRAAHEELERARTLAARGDAAGSVASYQRAFRSFALEPEARRACLTGLCDALHALGRPKIEAAWREVARALE